MTIMVTNDILRPGGVSVVVCCYNSANRLPETLKHLARQKLPDSTPWEVIVVNNASTDDTSDVAIRIWREAGQPAIFRVLDEPRPGKSFALDRGYLAADHDTLVTVDDDNWLDDDYLMIAHEAMQSSPRIGILGGRSSAHCEVEPPPWFEAMKSYLAVGKQAGQSGNITVSKPHVAGAGMVVRKSAYLGLKEKGFEFNLLGCTPGKTSAEDTELCYAMALCGYQIWYDERLHFVHFLPRERLTDRYIFQLIEQIYSTSAVLSVYESALRDPGRGVWLTYSHDVFKRSFWALKATVKFFIGRVNWMVCRLAWLGFCRNVISLPELLRVFRRHYPAILRLRENSGRE